jgi:hypothetical protein
MTFKGHSRHRGQAANRHPCAECEPLFSNCSSGARPFAPGPTGGRSSAPATRRRRSSRPRRASPVGSYPTVTLQYRSTTLYQVSYQSQSLLFESDNRILPYSPGARAAHATGGPPGGTTPLRERPRRRPPARVRPETHRADPESGPTLRLVHRDFHPNRGVSLRFLGRPCGLYLFGSGGAVERGRRRRRDRAWAPRPGLPRLRRPSHLG